MIIFYQYLWTDTLNWRSLCKREKSVREAKHKLIGKGYFKRNIILYIWDTEITDPRVRDKKRKWQRDTVWCEALTCRSKNTACLSCDCPGEKLPLPSQVAVCPCLCAHWTRVTGHLLAALGWCLLSPLSEQYRACVIICRPSACASPLPRGWTADT